MALIIHEGAWVGYNQDIPDIVRVNHLMNGATGRSHVLLMNINELGVLLDQSMAEKAPLVNKQRRIFTRA